jgi:hypothetical protein
MNNSWGRHFFSLEVQFYPDGRPASFRIAVGNAIAIAFLLVITLVLRAPFVTPDRAIALLKSFGP